MTPAAMAELQVENVAVRFGGLVALSGVSFSVSKGETVGLVGANGAGKTTAFNVITGFQRPTAGRIVYRGRSLSRLTPHQISALGLVRTFQRTSVFPNQTVLDNVLIGLHRMARVTVWDVLLSLARARDTERHMRDRARDLLHFVGIDQRSGDRAGAMSYGEQRLLGVAVALASNPSMLLLDEPVSGMNRAEKLKFMRLLDAIRALGIVLLLVEHDMPMVMGICDRVVVLHHGAIIANGPPSAIQRDPAVIRAYLGTWRTDCA